ncbi:Trehalose/maltose import ATP-binding protein MalK [Thermoplasmatales archaeon]|nr:Trehalose/maltose import ATP-binding protein MalK [Thermoplasmatales archaeon]
MNWIIAREISKTYGNVFALREISVEVPQGITVLYGENGSGKSTFISILEGLTRPTSGSAQILGFDVIKDYLDLQKSVAFMPEKPVNFGSGMVLDFIYWYCEITGADPNVVFDFLERADISYVAPYNFRNLSTGESKLLSVVLCLSLNRKFYVMDEPNSNADFDRREKILELIGEIHHERGASFLITTHLLDEVLSLSDYIAFIHGGVLKGITKTKDIFSDNRNYNIEIRGKGLSKLGKSGDNIVGIPTPGRIVMKNFSFVDVLELLQKEAVDEVFSVSIIPTFKNE